MMIIRKLDRKLVNFIIRIYSQSDTICCFVEASLTTYSIESSDFGNYEIHSSKIQFIFITYYDHLKKRIYIVIQLFYNIKTIHTLIGCERKRAMRNWLLLLVFLVVGGNQKHKRSRSVDSDFSK